MNDEQSKDVGTSIHPSSNHHSSLIYLTPRMLILLWLGLISGLPLALTASTLTAWLTENGINIKTIGIFALVGVPYTFKFMWAPLMDGLSPPLLGRMFGRRRSWMLVWLGCMGICCFLLAGVTPSEQLKLVAIFALLLAFASASFDVNLDALRIEMLPAEEQGAGAAMAVLGYRIGMIVSSAGALYLAEFYSWSTVYSVMALVLAAGVVPILLASYSSPIRGEVGRGALLEDSVKLCPLPSPPPTGEGISIGVWLKTYMIDPFVSFAEKQGWVLIIAFIILFKLGEALLGFMTNPFLLEAGYSKAEIASVVKLFGLIANITGGLLGGWIVMRLGAIKSLWIGGILQAVPNLGYIYLAQLGSPDINALGAVIFIDSFCGGVGTTAFVAYISGLCNLRFTATQYALLNSLASVGRIFFTTSSGVLASSLGWTNFFILTTLLGAPALLLLILLSRLQKQ